MSGIEALLSGHTLADRYLIEEVIGRGGYAAVYRAKDSRLQRTVAVKVVMVAAPDAAGRERARARFHREAQVAAQLQHANVVTIFDFGTDEKLGLDFLVMELLSGEDLSARIARSGPPPMDQSLRILREAAEGLAAGHRAGLVHRDVKSSNIFLEERSGTDVFRVLVLDFGIAQILESEVTVPSLTHGRTPLSPAYAAPEQLRDERTLTRAADVYGLGIVGFELLTGTRPFDRAGDEQARRVPPSIRAKNPEIPEGLARVIERALAYDPADRYQDAGEFAHALAAARTSVEAVAAPMGEMLGKETPPPVALPESSGYRARRHPRLPDEPVSAVPRSDGKGDGSRRAPLYALLLVALVAVGWWMISRGGQDEPEPVAVNVDTAAVPEETEFAGGLNPELPSGGSSDAPAGGAEAGPAPGGQPATGPGAIPKSGAAAAPAGGSGAVAAGSASAATLHARALRSFDARDYPAAIASLREAVAAAPGNAFYRNDLGWALFMAGDMGAAGRELEEVIRLDPGREIAYANLGEVRLAQGDTAAAIGLYQQFLSRNTDPTREAIAQRKIARIGG